MDVERALELVQQARAIAAERGVNATVAVHDDAGHPLVVVRGKRWHGPYMAMGKARLAAAFAKPTKDLVAQWADRPMFGASLVEIIPGGVTVNPGGMPLFDGRRVRGRHRRGRRLAPGRPRDRGRGRGVFPAVPRNLDLMNLIHRPEGGNNNMRRIWKRLRVPLTALFVLALVAASCGDDEADEPVAAVDTAALDAAEAGRSVSGG